MVTRQSFNAGLATLSVAARMQQERAFWRAKLLRIGFTVVS